MSVVFKKELRAFSPDEMQHANAIKDLAEDLYNLIDMVPNSRERDTAKIRLEEAVMWTLRAISGSM
jgi:hypothetical protein